MPKYQNYPVDIYKNLKEMFNSSAEKFGDKTLFMEKVNGTYRSLRKTSTRWEPSCWHAALAASA